MTAGRTFSVSELIDAVKRLSGGRLPAEAVNGAGALELEGFAPLEKADARHMAFVSNAKALAGVAGSGAAVLVLRPKDAEAAGEALASRPAVLTADPYAWFAWASQEIEGGILPAPVAGIDPRATVEEGAEIDSSARIEAGAFVAAGAKIGPKVWIGAGAYVGEAAEVGESTRIFPMVKLGDHVRIGRRCILNMGCAIGGEGFGFAPFQGQWVKIPQIGAVVVGDDVEIGANTTIDRGALEDTVIGEGTKIDDQVQIGHNCRIGRHCVICGCVGIAGSTQVGDHCVLGGAAMINGHISIPAGSMVGPATPIMSWDEKPDVKTGIFPALPHKDWERTAVMIRRLADMRQSIKALTRELAELKSGQGR